MKNNHFRLEEKTVVLTGPLSRHHIAIANSLAAMGADIGWIDRNVKDVERFAEQLNSQREIDPRHGRVRAIEADLTQSERVQDALSRVAEAFGSVDIYIDGMMLFQSGEFEEDDTGENLQRMIDVNLKAPIAVSQQMVKILRNRRRGRIIFLVGELQRLGCAREAINAACRNGLISLAKCLAQEYADGDMTVNCVAVGPSEEFLLQAFGDCQTVRDAEEKLKQMYPQLSTCDYEGTAQVVSFLASPLSGAIRGQVISASRGLAMFG